MEKIIEKAKRLWAWYLAACMEVEAAPNPTKLSE